MESQSWVGGARGRVMGHFVKCFIALRIHTILGRGRKRIRWMGSFMLRGVLIGLLSRYVMSFMVRFMEGMVNDEG